MKGEILVLEVTGREVTGLLALELPPGTQASVRDRALDGLLAVPLADEAEKLAAPLAAAPSRYARPRDGKDEQGRTVFEVQGRLEGGRLVPIRKRT